VVPVERSHVKGYILSVHLPPLGDCFESTHTGIWCEGDSAPALSQMELGKMPTDYDFRPHGLYIDNATNRV